MIPVSKITGEEKYTRQIPLSKILGNTSPEEESEDEGILNSAVNALGWWKDTNLAGAGFLGGLAAETAGNALQTLGDPDRTLSARYSPDIAKVLRSAGSLAQDAADTMLEYGAKKAPVANDENISGAFGNSFSSGVFGGVGNLASMIHSDKTADAMNQVAQATANKNPVPAELSWEYFTNPHGLASDFGQLAGSMAAIAPAMFAMPESLALRGAAALGGDAITQALINRGLFGAARVFSKGAPTAFRYSATSAPVEGAMEGGETRRERLAQGASEDEATRSSINTMGKNIPLLFGTNLIEGFMLGAPLARIGKAGQIAGRSVINFLQQQFEEGTQRGIQNEELGRPYSYNPLNWAPDQSEAASRVRYPALILGGVGGATHAISRPNENVKNWEQGSQENISNENYSERAAKSSKNLRSWVRDISGGQMDDGVFNSIVRNARELGYSPEEIQFALALATAESTGDQNALSGAGAIGVMQLTPETAEGLGVNPHDREENIRGGLTYLKQMLEIFNGDWNLAAAAYNSGPGRVKLYGGIPPFEETQNYVARINGFLDSAPEFDNNTPTDTEGVSYLGSNGRGEWNTWQRQHDGVSFEGAQPQLLDAVDVLGKWFYDRTGKRLVVTAATNGSHADGEHSHVAGWKVDVNDWDGESDGYLVTADRSKGSLTDEFIKFGQSIGLGMNWEGDHIDVALDGTQWADENGNPLEQTQNFGGFNPRNRQSSSKRKGRSSRQENPQPQEQPKQTKPPFDLNEQLLEQFAREKKDTSTGEQAAQDSLFFEPMFKNDKFMNTKENRDAILEQYGDEFNSFAEKIFLDTAFAEPDNKSKSKRKEQASAIKKVAEQYEIEIPNEVSLSLDKGAIKAVREAQNILQQSSKLPQNILAQPEQTQQQPQSPPPQPAQPQQDPVTQNQPPENILLQEQKRAAQIADIKTAQAEEQARQAQEQARLKSAEQSRQAGKQAQTSFEEAQIQSVQQQRQQEQAQNNSQPPLPPQTATPVLNPVLQDEQGKRFRLVPKEGQGMVREYLDEKEPPAQPPSKIIEAPQETPPKQNADVYGRTAQASSKSRALYPVRYKVVEAKTLSTSHKIDGLGVVKNDDYKGYQPRDRERADQTQQIIEMANRFDPVFALDTALSVNDGSAFVTNDGTVWNGNRRTMALQYAYENNDKGKLYKNALIERAGDFGLNADEISKMNQPVLVREFAKDLTDAEKTDIADTTAGGSGMSASEQAKSDAKKLTANVFDGLPQDGVIDFRADKLSASAKELLTKVLRAAENSDDISRYTQSDGSIAQDGATRAERAILAYTYPRDTIIARLTEATDPVIKTINNALLNAAPNLFRVRAGMEHGNLHKYDLDAIADAVDKFADLKAQGKKVSDYMKEGELEGTGLSAEAKEILSVFDNNNRSAKNITEFLNGIAQGIVEQGDPNQGSLFGPSEPESFMSLIKKARQKVEGDKSPKYSKSGEVDTRIEKFVEDEDLTPQQKLLKSFGEKLGTRTRFFDNQDTRFHGVRKEGTTFLNVNSEKPLEKVFWHETLHWLSNNNPKIFKDLMKTTGITDEEILADQMEDIAKRTGLLQNVAGKNRGLIERVVQWLKDTMNKFIDHFRNPQGKLTTKQSIALADEFGKIAKDLKDADGKKIFRYNRQTHNIELADGRGLTEIKTVVNDGNLELPEGYHTESGRPLNESVSKEFIVDKNGNRNMGEISKAIEQKTNGLVKSAPVRLQVGVEKSDTQKGFGYVHISKHLKEIQDRGFSDIPSYVKHILSNFNQVYQAEDGTGRITLYCKGDKSKGLMPLDLELEESGDNYYTVVTAYPRRRANKNETLLVDTRPTNASTVAATVPHERNINNQNGVEASRDIVEESSVSDKNITQSERDSKPKYSIGNYTEQSFFDKTKKKFVKSLAKVLGVDGDEIVTAEGQRNAQLQEQKKAMDAYLKEPTKENRKRLRDLHITDGQLDAYRNGEEYLNEIGLVQNYRSSPSRIADKVATFRAFFNMGDKAMDKLVELRDGFFGRYNAALDLVKNKEDRAQLFELLWDGDQEKKVFSKEEMLQDGVKENVADAYIAIRRQLERAYNLLNDAQRRPRNHAQHLSDDEIKELQENKFTEKIKINDERDEKGRRLVTWTEYQNDTHEVTVGEETLEKFKADDAIQILSEKKLEGGKYKVKYREGIPALEKIKGYIPHFFHSYVVTVRDAQGKQVTATIGTGRTQREAIKIAEAWKKNHTLHDGAQLYISPKTFSPADFGMDENFVPVMGDKDFVTMMKQLAKNNDLELSEAKEILDGAVKLKNRHRFLGQLLKRKGYEGYEKDMDWILRHHFNTASRYVALETEFKPKAMSLFERVFGAFDKDHSKNLLAQYTKNYINDVNGVPAWIDDVTNKTLNQNSTWRKWFLPALGEHAMQNISSSIVGRTAWLTLGMANISSAVLNFTQLVNASGYLGWAPVMKHFGRIASRGGKLTRGELRILHESGVLSDIGLDTASSYDKNRGYGSSLPGLKQLDWLGNKSMIPFQVCDSLCRVSTALAAYEKALSEGKTKTQALAYAKKINRDANFSYGIEDAPNIMRRTGAFGKIGFQFMKYSFKQLEVIADFMPQSKVTNFKQKAQFWLPYLLLCGLTGILPGFDWLDKIFSEKLGLFPKDFVQKICIQGSREIFGDNETGRTLGKIAMYGAPSLFNIDVSQRAGLSNMVPQDMYGAAFSKFFGAAGSLAQGNYANALRSVSPGLFNLYAATYAGEIKDARGRTVSVYEDTWSRIIRGLGFRSADEAIEADITRINYNERDEETKQKQNAIDDYIADPSPENLKRLKELKIKPDRVKEERKKKKLDRKGRLEQNMTKAERKRNQYLLDFAK